MVLIQFAWASGETAMQYQFENLAVERAALRMDTIKAYRVFRAIDVWYDQNVGQKGERACDRLELLSTAR